MSENKGGDTSPSSSSPGPAAAAASPPLNPKHPSRVREGLLKKRSQGRWSSRYYVLYKDVLVYSKTETSKPSGVIPLLTFHFASQLTEKNGCRFDFLVRGYGGKISTFCMLAPTADDAKEWVNQLKYLAKTFETAHPQIKNVHVNERSFQGKFWHSPAQMILMVKTWELGKGERSSSILAQSMPSAKFSVSMSAANMFSGRESASSAAMGEEENLDEVRGRRQSEEALAKTVITEELNEEELAKGVTRPQSTSLFSKIRSGRSTSPASPGGHSTSSSQPAQVVKRGSMMPFSTAFSGFNFKKPTLLQQNPPSQNNSRSGSSSPRRHPRTISNDSGHGGNHHEGRESTSGGNGNGNTGGGAHNHNHNQNNKEQSRAQESAQTQAIMTLNAKARGTLHLSGVLKIKEAVEMGLAGVIGVYRWHKRYFALYDEVLMYYRTKGGDPVGGLLLPLVTRVVIDHHHPAAFEIFLTEPFLPNNNSPYLSSSASSSSVPPPPPAPGPQQVVVRSYNLIAKSGTQAEQWVTALRVRVEFTAYKRMLEDGVDPDKAAAHAGGPTITVLNNPNPSTSSNTTTATATATAADSQKGDSTTTTTTTSTSTTSTTTTASTTTTTAAANQADDGDDEDGVVREGRPFAGFAAHSEKGFVVDTEKHNQDFQLHALDIGDDPTKALFVVCDGHGPDGHHISSFVGTNLIGSLVSDPNLRTHTCRTIRNTFAKIAQDLLKLPEVDASYSGTTCIALYLDGNTLYSCNVGDCRAVIGKRMDVWDCAAVPVSCDHKPSRPDEKRRIEAVGGRCEPKKGIQGDIGSARVWLKDQDIPGLAVTRAFGDTVAASVGVNAVPEIWKRKIQTNDAFIILASDGVWEFISSEEAVDIVAQAETAEEGVEHLIDEAKKRWAQEDWEARDDITCQVVFF